MRRAISSTAFPARRFRPRSSTRFSAGTGWAVRRILLGGKDSGRADDASEDVIRNRIKVYREQTEVVGAYYARQNKYFEVDGVGSMDEVFDRICRVVDAHR